MAFVCYLKSETLKNSEDRQNTENKIKCYEVLWYVGLKQTTLSPKTIVVIFFSNVLRWAVYAGKMLKLIFLGYCLHITYAWLSMKINESHLHTRNVMANVNKNKI